MKHTKLAIAIIIAMIAMHTRAQTQKPNIILILGDDIGYKVPTVNGGKSYSTPNLDKMAKKGMNFTQCHATPLCSPSRFLLLTGKHNFRNYTEWGYMDKSQKTIANMLKDSGYKTACFGKWQLDGGSASIEALGFNNYCVWDAFDADVHTPKYKNPFLYANGKYLPDELTLNKYGEDVVADSLMNFIEKNKKDPFFIYYSMILAHAPHQPTPDDADFASWTSATNSDTSYFASMIKYMDKKIGLVTNKVKKLGIENNTIIIYVGDNGTSRQISEYVDDDSLITGGKGLTTENGTHVPMIIYWPGIVSAGSINNYLIGFTDFLPTLAEIANIPLPTNYGPLDGVSFASRLTGNEGTPRDWLFYHYDSHPGESELARWAQTTKYKLYDTSSSSQIRLFYDIKKDVSEEHPIDDSSLTAQEVIIKQQLLDVINSYVKQGTPLISLNPSLSLITNSSAVLKDTIKTNGGSTVTASGAVWSTNPNPKISSSNYTLTGKSWGVFSTQVTGLTANATYYIRAYATNFAGTVYSNQIIFKTLLAIPVATAATGIDSNKFIANWKAYAGAIGYRLDVSTSPAFAKVDTVNLTEGFNNDITPPTGWTISDNIRANTNSFATSSPSLEFKTSNAQVITKLLNGPAMQLKFWMKGLNTEKGSSLLVEGFDGNEWKTIAKLTKLLETGETKIFNANSNPPLAPGFIQFRFTYLKEAGTLVFDDVSIEYNKPVPFFIPGYNDLIVETNSKEVTGLKPGTNYYYRVRAVTNSATTGNSNVITTITKKAASVIDITKLHQTCGVMDNNSIIAAKGSDLNVHVFPNPSSDEFIFSAQTDKNEKIEIIVTDIHGREVYRATGSSNNKYTFGRTFAPGEYIVSVNIGILSKTIKIIKVD